MGFDAGLVISASHNPFEDNGIKVFSGRGEKFTETLEREVEAIVADRSWQRRRQPATCRSSARTSIDAYIAHARLALPDPRAARPVASSRSTRANGATTTVAPRLFRELGLRRRSCIGDAAGRPQHQPRLRLDASRAARARRCVERGCRMGVAFDGDGDRAIFVDARRAGSSTATRCC